jgi:hypothetical protein
MPFLISSKLHKTKSKSETPDVVLLWDNYITASVSLARASNRLGRVLAYGNTNPSVKFDLWGFES